jgi:hypothetical protein
MLTRPQIPGGLCFRFHPWIAGFKKKKIWGQNLEVRANYSVAVRTTGRASTETRDSELAFFQLFFNYSFRKSV